MPCTDDPGNILGQAVDATNPFCAVGKVADSVFAVYVDDLKAGLAELVKTLTTFWVSLPSPNLGDDQGGMSPTIDFLRSHTAWYSGGLLVLAIIISGAQIALQRPGAPGKFFVLVMTNVVVQGASVALIVLLLAAADGFSSWIIERSTDGTDFADNLVAALTAPLGSGLLAIILLVIAMLVSVLQVLMMIARGAALVVLTGTLLLTAATVNSETGMQAFRKQCSWILAFILIKPVAAVIYAAGFNLLGADTAVPQGLLSICYGLALLSLAVFSLPATMRLIAPVVAPASGGKGAGTTMMAAAATAGAGVAGGAKALAR